MKVCSAKDCKERHSARGYCKYHYNRLNRYGDLEDRSRARGTCSVEGCSGPHVGHGYCDKHFRRFMKHGDPLGSAPRVPRSTPCKVEGCLRLSKSNGMCGTHAARMDRWGDPTVVRKKSKKEYVPYQGVYFAVCQNKVKIGFSKDIRKRLISIQVDCPDTVRLLGASPGDLGTEASYHVRFERHHSHGEWFHLEEEILDFARHLQESQPQPQMEQLGDNYSFEEKPLSKDPRPRRTSPVQGE